MTKPSPRVIHIVSLYEGNSPLKHRQDLFLESVKRSHTDEILLATSRSDTPVGDWKIRHLARTASNLGDKSDKPFLKDLLDLASAEAASGDWLLYSNVDCSLAPDLYADLVSRRATVVEYQRQDVDGDPQTLDELFSRPTEVYSIGVDALAIRAGFYRDVRDLLPDFIVGEPHWDTVYSGILRKLIPVQRDSSRLYHPKHEQAWDLASPNPAGWHNHGLLVDSLNRGYLDNSMITEAPDRTDTAVIIGVFGNDPKRIQANTTGIREQLRQDLYADFFLVDLVMDDTPSLYPSDLLSQLNHVLVRGSDASADLFQKEALLNLGWRKALEKHPYEYFIFVDADVYSLQMDWFRLIRERLREDASRAVQGWRIAKDTIDGELKYSSVGAAFVLDQPTDLPLNPGMCWGLRRSLLEAGGGLNPYCLDCSGDSAFVAEYLNNGRKQYDPWLYQWTWFREIERELPFHAQLDCVPVDLWHVHHGYLKERNYDGFRYAMDSLPPLHQLIALNGEGLLEWKDPGCRERTILTQRAAMGSRPAVEQLLSRHAYPRYQKPPLPARNGHSKRLFSPSNQDDSGGKGPIIHRPEQPRSGLRIFDPEQVFREDFPFSWCDGVVKKENSTFAPIVDTPDSAVLFLNGKPDASYVVCALPLQPTWLPTDISGFGCLRFSIRVSEPGPEDVFALLVSRREGTSETESEPLGLRQCGLTLGQWMELAIPLSSFRGEVDLTSIRMVKFVGHASFRLELAKIYVE